MMALWFRLYADLLNDPKVQNLDGDLFKSWINILCIASANEGILPPIDDIAFALRMDKNGAETVVERLHNATLIDRVNGGPNGWHYAPHGWRKRQYKSDSSTDRVKRFRKRSSNGDVTPPETETDTETDNIARKALSGRDRPMECPADVTATAWQDFLKLRKAKRAPITETALSTIRREAGKAGWELQAALEECVARGWQGFKADWVREAKDDPMANFIV